MSYTFSAANVPASGAAAFYLLKTTLVTAGWSVISDSDGTTYASGGGQVTTGAAGGHGLGNTKAWIRMQAPSVNGFAREIIFQRGSVGNRDWRLKYSASAGFSGGSPSATVTPSSTDEVFMLGGGTDASPTFISNWFNTDGAYHWNLVCGGAAEFYSFVAFAHTTATTNANVALFLDVMATNGFAPGDTDPAVMYCSAANATATPLSEIISSSLPTTTVTNPALGRAWMGTLSAAGASTSSNNVNVGLVCLGSSTCTLGGGGGGGTGIAVNPFTGNDDMFQPFYARASNQVIKPTGFKGFSTLFLLGAMHRTNLDTATTLATGDRIHFGTAWLPWNNAAP